jgi:hypothetical protein
MDKITKYPLFGKAYLVEDPFGGYAYRPPGGGYTTSPVISGGEITSEVTIYGNTPTRIFSNGSEFDRWTHYNCNQCKKQNMEAGNPDDIRIQGGCCLELRIALAYMDDGKIPFKTVKRIGTRYVSISERGVFAGLSACKEKELISEQGAPVSDTTRAK